MKALFTSKTLIALAFCLIFVGTSAVLLGGFAEKGIGATGSSGSGGGGGGAGGVGGEGEGVDDDDSPLCGFAWGATGEAVSGTGGVGWISFNSKDCDTDGNGTISSEESSATPGCPAGGTASYSVTVDNNRYLNGYAWSSNIGWIDFGGLSSIPNGGSDARINSSNPNNNDVSGWVRAVVAAGRNDGWDGWINLRGNNTVPPIEEYGVVYNAATKKFSGDSWGGVSVGWVNWDTGSGRGVRYCVAPTLTANLEANPSSGTTVPNGLDVDLTASSNMDSDSATRYSFSCDYGENFSSPSTTRTYECNYPLPDTYYHPEVRITATGGLSSTARDLVHTDPVAASGDISVVCSVSDTDSDDEHSFINQTVTWTAEASAGGVTLPNYTYEFLFDDNGDGNFLNDYSPTDVVRNNIDTPATFDRTYSTLGSKAVQVRVTDGSTPAITSAACETVRTSVIVKPIIREI